MLIDELLPTYDVVERHAITVHAPPAATYAALLSTDFGRSGLLRALLVLRALPAVLARRPHDAGSRARSRPPLTLSSIESHGFVRLAAAPDSEIVFGLEGRFWALDGGRCTPPAAAFRTTAPSPGTARAVWNFALASVDATTTRATTETRVLCADAATRRRFLPYWALIRPGSGLIRRDMLRRLRAAAERAPR